MNSDKSQSPQLQRRELLAGGISLLGGAMVAGQAIGQAPVRPDRVRHYVLATHDRDFVCDQIYEFLGLAPTPKPAGPGTTEKYGFYSTMMRVGGTMLEIVQPIKPDHHLNGWLAERGGDGGYMVVMQNFDAAALKARAAQENLKLTRDQMFLGQHMTQFDYKRFGTHFETYQYSPEDDWWGNPLTGPYSDARVASDVVGGEVAVENPQEIAAQIARLFNGGTPDGEGVRFGDKKINFVPSDGQWRGLVALDLKAREAQRVGDWARIGGVKFRLV